MMIPCVERGRFLIDFLPQHSSFKNKTWVLLQNIREFMKVSRKKKRNRERERSQIQRGTYKNTMKIYTEKGRKRRKPQLLMSNIVITRIEFIPGSPFFLSWLLAIRPSER